MASRKDSGLLDKNQPTPEDDMHRHDLSMPTVYGYSNDDGWHLKTCWYCRCLSCCCGWAQARPQPCVIRVADCYSTYVAWRGGMYVGANHFDRKTLESFLSLDMKKPGYDKSSDVTSIDVLIPSTFVPGHKVRVRLFEKGVQLNSGGSKKPIFIYIHGGGWVIMHADSGQIHVLCNYLAEMSECVVVSVEYRLAPENPFPAAVEDCFDVLKWISSRPAASYFTNVDFSRISIGGDSAGGNLSLVMTSLVRDRLDAHLKSFDLGIDIERQVLIYPALMMRRFVKEPLPSDAYFIPKQILDFFYSCYIPGATREEKRAFADTERRLSPIVAGFHKMPRTLILDAELDNLSHENLIAYELFKRNGIDVERRVFENQVHGFAIFPQCRAAREARRVICEELRKPKPASPKDV